MRVRAIVSILAGLGVAIAIGVVINLLTSGAGPTVATVAGIAAFVVSAFAAVIASRQAFTARKQLESQDRDYVIGGLMEQTIDPGRISTIGQDHEAQLLHQFRLLERDAGLLLDREPGEDRRTIFKLRADLNMMSVWSAEDIANFDRAVKVRNSIVHGAVPVSPKDTARASEIVEGLRQKIRQALRDRDTDKSV